MKVIKNRLTAVGRPIHLAGDYEETCAGAWLHYDYLAEHVDVGAVGLDGRQSVMFAAIPEPDNPYDANAVAISLDNRHVGYLPAAIAAVYAPLLADLIRQGLVPFIRGQIYMRWLPASADYPEPKKWVAVDLYVEDTNVPEPIPVWNIQGTRELAAEGAGLLAYDAESYWATAEGHELDALRDFMSTSDGEYAIVRLVVLPSARPSNTWRVGIQHKGVTLGQLSSVSSSRYRVHLLAAEALGVKLAVVIRVPRPSRRDGCSVLIHRDLLRLPNGCPAADYEFTSEKPPVPFTLTGEITELPDVKVDFETVHTYRDEQDFATYTDA